ncbi:MAG: GyrI-like domain-containing protein, partial [Vicingaceae bacterium]
VSWGIESEIVRPFNVLGLFMSMEDAIGEDYDKGLNNLKELAEKAKEEAENESEYTIETVNFEEKDYLTFRDRISFSEMQAFFSENLGAIFQLLSENPATEIAGPASGIYYDWDEANGEAELAAAVPFTITEEVDFEKYEVVTLGGEALKIAYYGAYEKLNEPHEAIHAYLEEKDLPMSHTVLEEYVTDPGQEPDTAKWLTNIYYFNLEE